MPTPFYSVLESVSVFLALSTVFHFMNSPESSPLSYSVLPVLSLCLVGPLNYIPLYESLPQPCYNPLWLTGLKAPTNQIIMRKAHRVAFADVYRGISTEVSGIRAADRATKTKYQSISCCILQDRGVLVGLTSFSQTHGFARNFYVAATNLSTTE